MNQFDYLCTYLYNRNAENFAEKSESLTGMVVDGHRVAGIIQNVIASDEELQEDMIYTA